MKREAKYCPGCQIALCDRYISRGGTGSPICPAVVYGPILAVVRPEGD